MIEFKFSCPSCGQHIQATSAYSGRQLNCPACQKPMVVPHVPGAPAPVPAAATPPPVPAAATPPPIPPRAAQAAPAAPPMQRAAAAPAGRPIAPAKKKETNPVLKAVVGTVSFLVSGTVTYMLMTGGFHRFHSRSTPTDSFDQTSEVRKASVETDSRGADPSGPTAAEIVRKVSNQYSTFTSYSAEGTAVMDLDMSKVDAKTMNAMEQGVQGDRKSRMAKAQSDVPKEVKNECQFTVRMARPDMYRVQWDNKNGQASVTGAAWSVGDGDFVSIAKTKYTKMESREIALATATRMSAGVAGTMPSIFFNDPSSQLGVFKTATRGEDDSVDGEDCYVLNGEAMGMKITLWITQDTYLIKQKQMIFGGSSKPAVLTDAQIEKMGNLTSQQKEQAKAAMKNAKPMLAQMQGTMTETYRNIETNRQLSKTDFQYELPSNATLSKSLY